MDPLRDLCPRAVVVWRDGAARCTGCARRVNRVGLGHPYRHVPDFIDDRLEDLIRLDLKARLDAIIDGPAVLVGPVTVAPGAGVFIGEGPDRQRVGDLVDAVNAGGVIEVTADVAAEVFEHLRQGHHLSYEDTIDAALRYVPARLTDTEETI